MVMIKNESNNNFYKNNNAITIIFRFIKISSFVIVPIFVISIVTIKDNSLNVSVNFDKMCFYLNCNIQDKKYENILTIDSINNCSTLNGISESSKTIYLKKGRYEITPAGGAWSAWGSNNSYREENVKGAWTWVVYGAVQAGDTFCLGFCDNWWRFLTEEDAQLYGVNIGSEIISLDQDRNVYFWVYDDGGNIYDNRGKLKLKIKQL